MADTATPDTKQPDSDLDLAALRRQAELSGSDWADTILSLLDRIEELTKERDFFRSGYVGANTTLQLIRDVNHGGQ